MILEKFEKNEGEYSKIVQDTIQSAINANPLMDFLMINLIRTYMAEAIEIYGNSEPYCYFFPDQ